MKLFYTVNSPYARKVRIVLAERGLPFEPALIEVDSAPEEFYRANPNRRVPCLLDDGHALFESNVIIEWLLRVPGGKASGEKPPLARSLTRPEHHLDDLLLLTTIETLFDSALNTYGLLRDGINAEQSHTLRRELKRIESELDWLEARVGPQGFIPGVFSIQDLNLTVALQWLDFRKPAPWRGRPGLEALVSRYEGRASVRATLPGG
jgi:glutathione S-transferase